MSGMAGIVSVILTKKLQTSIKHNSLLFQKIEM